MEVSVEDWRRHLNLGWDSHVIKDMLGFCPHTKRLIGYAHNAFDLDVICSEFKRKYKKEEEGDATELGDTNCDDGEVEDTGAKCDDLKLGKHYMVFMALSITSKGRPMSFMAARYCLSSLNPLGQDQQVFR